MTDKNCMNCGTLLTEGADNCHRCGARQRKFMTTAEYIERLRTISTIGYHRSLANPYDPHYGYWQNAIENDSYSREDYFHNRPDVFYYAISAINKKAYPISDDITLVVNSKVNLGIMFTAERIDFFFLGFWPGSGDFYSEFLQFLQEYGFLDKETKTPRSV